MPKKDPTLCPCCHKELVCKNCRKVLDADKLLLTCSKCNSPTDVNLSSRNASIWLMYRGFGMPQDEIKKYYNVSQGRISQICNELEEHLPLLKELQEAYSQADAYKHLQNCKNPFGKSHVAKYTKMTKRNDDSDYIHAKKYRELEKVATEMLKLDAQAEKILAKTTEKEKYFSDIKQKTAVSKSKVKN